MLRSVPGSLNVARATTTTGRCLRTWSGSFAAIWSAASSRTALRGRGVNSAGTTSYRVFLQGPRCLSLARCASRRRGAGVRAPALATRLRAPRPAAGRCGAAMGQWEHGGGFSVDGSVRIEAADRAGRERLLRYCARPPFALDRLRELDPERLLYESTKPGPGGNGTLLLTPLELLDRLAALVPPPRIHRHRYFGVLAPNSPLRTAVTALASTAITPPPAASPQPTPEPAHRRAARYAWALLLARVYEAFPISADTASPATGTNPSSASRPTV